MALHSWTYIRWAGALVLVTALGCGGEEDATNSDKDAAGGDASGDGSTADSGGSDTAGSDTAGSDGSGDTGSKDTSVTDTGPADSVVQGPSCDEGFACRAKCPDGDKACADACVKDMAAGAAAALAAVDSCAVDLCKDVTEGAVAVANCAFDKCFDKLDACFGFGAGDATCAAASVCAANCVLGDASCKLACLQGAAKTAVAGAKALRACADAGCKADATPTDRAACLISKCGDAIKACVGADATDCRQGNGCIAHCHESIPGKANVCASACLAFATDGARAASIALQTCKDQCKLAINPVACWAEKCGTELQSCYGTGGAEACQSIDNCVSEKCEGVGGESACQTGCITKGKPGSQDAFVLYEGCIIKHMDTKEAKAAGCSFPYDIATCVKQIQGFYCSSQTQTCFTDK